MRVQINEPRGHRKAGRLDLPVSGLAHAADFHDGVSAYGDLCRIGFAPEAIHDGSSAYHYVMSHVRIRLRMVKVSLP